MMELLSDTFRRKFVTVLTGIVIALGAKWGFNLDPNTTMTIIGAFTLVAWCIMREDVAKKQVAATTSVVTTQTTPASSSGPGQPAASVTKIITETGDQAKTL